MAKFLMFVLLVGAAAFGGWIYGSMHPAPPALVDRIDRSAVVQRVRGDLQGMDWSALRESMSAEELQAFTGEASRIAVEAGNLIVVERSTDENVAEAAASSGGGYILASAPEPAAAPTTSAAPAASSAPAGASAPAAQGAAAAAFEAVLTVCPRMTVSNAPRADAQGRVASYSPVVNVNGSRIAVNPTTGSCLSSGLGTRNGRAHKGLDFRSENGGPIMAGGDGTIVEMKYRDDYGNMVLIDHGNGVYTRYAHLSTFRSGLAVGQRVTAGQVIGLMGNTASYAIPVHLHYELLLGNYNTAAQSFGLTPRNPLEFPRAT